MLSFFFCLHIFSFFTSPLSSVFLNLFLLFSFFALTFSYLCYLCFFALFPELFSYCHLLFLFLFEITPHVSFVGLGLNFLLLNSCTFSLSILQYKCLFFFYPYYICTFPSHFFYINISCFLYSILENLCLHCQP